jgi:hypothetical protein
MAETEILPCPFCGGPAETSGYDYAFYVRCLNPECIAVSHGLHYETQDEAITAWNRRPPSPDVGELWKGLRKAAEQLEFYAREHRNKAAALPGTSTTDPAYLAAHAKADTNQRLADEFRALLAKHAGKG